MFACIARVHKTTNAPLNLTALCIIFSGRIFFSTRAIGPMNLDFFGLQMSLASRNEKNPHGAVKFIGALIVNIYIIHTPITIQYMIPGSNIPGPLKNRICKSAKSKPFAKILYCLGIRKLEGVDSGKSRACQQFLTT